MSTDAPNGAAAETEVPGGTNVEGEAPAVEATVETEVATGGPFDALVDAAAGHDAVVMGEQAPSLRSLLFGEESERIAAETVGPVLVVRRPAAADDDSA